VTATVLPDQPGRVVIESITGDGGRLTLDPAKNCIGVAATETLKLLGQVSCGVSLKLEKVRSKPHATCSPSGGGRCNPRGSSIPDHGAASTRRGHHSQRCRASRPPHALQGLPLGSGMGSSAASAAAAAVAVNGLFGSPLTKDELVFAGLASEAVVSGYHADNVAPALMGGFVLVRWGWPALLLLPLLLWYLYG
jgi:homoserine kinase